MLIMLWILDSVISCMVCIVILQYMNAGLLQEPGKKMKIPLKDLQKEVESKCRYLKIVCE